MIPSEGVQKLMTRSASSPYAKASLRTRPSGCSTPTASKSCSWSTRNTGASASITVKDMENAVADPHACRTSKAGCAWRLRPRLGTWASSVPAACLRPTEWTSSSSIPRMATRAVLEAVTLKRASNAVQVVAGNIATAEGAQALIDAAPMRSRSIGPGSICATRIVAGVGVPQLTAILDAVEVARKSGTPVIADGGIEYPAISPRRWQPVRTCGMIGSLLAGTDETPGECFSSGTQLQELPRHRVGDGHGARLADRYFQRISGTRSSWCRKGWRARCPIRALRPACCISSPRRCGRHGLCGARTLAEFVKRLDFMRVSAAGMRESHVHDITITRESPNSPSRA